MTERHKAMFLPGPLHMFRAGGMYYAYELSRDFDMVMVLDWNYQNDPTVQRLLKTMPCAEVIYLPPYLTTLKRHSYYVELFSTLTKRHKPRLVLQHNNNYLWNMYLFHFARRAVPDCLRAIYLTGQGFIDATPFVRLARLEQVDMLNRRFHLPRALAGFAFDLRMAIYYALHHAILPVLHVGRRLMPRENYLTAETQWPRRPGNFDVAFVTHRLNVDFMREQQHAGTKVELVAHPSSTIGARLHAALYGDLGDGHGIVVLPSNAYALTKMKDEGWTGAETVEYFGALWADAIRRLMKRLPDYRVLWKLHPSSADDPLMNAVMMRVKQAIPALEIRDVKESAELLALANHVLVSDVSNVLYWSRLFPELLPISLDIFGVRGGGEMAAYDGILYINDPSQLDVKLLEPPTSQEKNLPSFADIVAQHLRAFAQN